MDIMLLKKIIFIFSMFIISFFPFFSQNVFAENQESVGVIINVIGKVEVLREGKTLKAVKEFPVYEMDTILTGESSAVKVNFKDGSNFMGFENTRFKISEYKMKTNKSDGINLKSAIDILKGKVRFFVKPKEEGINDSKITTPNAVMLIRGTSGGVSTECGNAKSGECSSTVGDEGTYDIFNPADSTHHEVITENHYSEVWGNKPPTPPVLNSSALDFYNQNAKSLDVDFKSSETKAPSVNTPEQSQGESAPPKIINSDGTVGSTNNSGAAAASVTAAATAAAAANAAASLTGTAAGTALSNTNPTVNKKKDVNIQFNAPTYP